MLSSEEFKKFAGEFVVFAHVTTWIKDRKYDGLLSEKGGRGFPYLVAMNKDGLVNAVLAPADRNIAGLRALMEAGSKLEALRTKAGKTTAEELELLKHDIAAGNLKLDAATAWVAKLKDLTEAQKKEIDGLLLGLEIQAAMGNPKSQQEATALALAAGKTFAEMWAAGREPTTDEQVSRFFGAIVEHAHETKDVALFEKALGKLRDAFGTNPRAAGFFKKQDERLEALKAPAAPATPEPENKDTK